MLLFRQNQFLAKTTEQLNKWRKEIMVYFLLSILAALSGFEAALATNNLHVGVAVFGALTTVICATSPVRK